jgi:stearoyl-CoA desaturase (delta-9 desaturase)
MAQWFKSRWGVIYLYRVITHSALAYLLVTGTWVEWLFVAMVVFLRTILGTVIIHRLLAHKSFTAPKWFEYLGSLISVIGNGASAIAWVALHREHHRFSDTQKDPHSPVHKGFLSIQLGNYPSPNVMYAADMLRSGFYLFCHKYHWLFFLATAAILYSIDPRAPIYGLLVPSVFILYLGSLVNSLNHTHIGYRNYETRDSSMNNILTGILLMGEGWHNNHHAAPADAQFGKKWWEFDLGWQVIKLVRK